MPASIRRTLNHSDSTKQTMKNFDIRNRWGVFTTHKQISFNVSHEFNYVIICVYVEPNNILLIHQWWIESTVEIVCYTCSIQFEIEIDFNEYFLWFFQSKAFKMFDRSFNKWFYCIDCVHILKRQKSNYKIYWNVDKTTLYYFIYQMWFQSELIDTIKLVEYTLSKSKNQ